MLYIHILVNNSLNKFYFLLQNSEKNICFIFNCLNILNFPEFKEKLMKLSKFTETDLSNLKVFAEIQCDTISEI